MAVPKLRFKGFDEDWKNLNVGDIGDVKMCRRVFNHETTQIGDIPFFKIGSFGKSADAFITKELFVNYKQRFPYPKVGDILISAAGTIGRTVVFNGQEAYFQDSNIVWINNDEKIVFNSYFKYILQKVRFNTEGGTIQRLYNNILLTTKFAAPNLAEQQKIAGFLTSVDEKIDRLKKKKELLEQYKKGVMQKIFSQELRFKDDEGNDFPEWEEKELGEVFTHLRGNGLSKDKLVTEGKYPCILYGELYTTYKEQVFRIKSSTNFQEGLTSKIGDLLMPNSTTTTGIDLANFTALNFDNILLGGDITVLRAKQNVSNVFYAYYFSNYMKYELAGYSQGSTIIHLYYSHIKNLQIKLPSLIEQEKIAHFLTTLDEKTALVEQQINKTELWKKGLLHQLFV